MKKILIIILLFLATTKAVKAQQIEVQDTPPNWDAMMSNLNTAPLNNGVLYNRVGMFANLYDYNRGVFNLSHADHFLQGINELHYASLQTNFSSAKQLSASIDASQPSVVDVGIINATINVLNFNEKDPSTGGLTFNNDKFVPIAGRPSFLSRTILLASPLREIATGSYVTYRFSNNLIFNVGSSAIKTLTVFFHDGTPNLIISNGALITTAKTVNYATSGTKMIRFEAVFADNSTITTVGYHHFENATVVRTAMARLANVPTTPCDDDLKERGTFKSTLAFKGYDEATAYYGKFDYTIFYHTKNNLIARERRMIKPIIVIDGFDPGDTRKTTDCDCESDRTPKGCFEKNSDIKVVWYPNQLSGLPIRVFNPDKHESIEDNMLYNVENTVSGLLEPKNLVTKLREEGYDVLVLNIPQYSTSAEGSSVDSKNIDGGGDYIERNGLALASYLQQTKAKLTQNGSSENIVIIGPSMGGLISRYGLAYMEKREAEATTQPEKDLWKHNTRLWVSFDSPHLGANIPLGAQANIWFLGEKLRNSKAEEKFNNQLNSTAGKQLLISQFSNVLNTMSGGTGYSNNSPFFAQSQYNLNSNGVAGSGGFPVSNSNFRKVSIINGSLSGVKNGVEGGEFLNVRGYKDPNVLEGLVVGAAVASVVPFVGTITGAIFGGLLGASKANVTVLRCRDSFYPAYGQTNDIFNGDGQNFAIGWSQWHINHKWYNLRGVNNDLRGSMDVVPGGTFTTGKILRDEITKGLEDSGMSSEVRGTNIDEHSFISSFSSMAHLQPNQNWSNPLDNNLACALNKQTPFDSYFGLKENTGHIKLNKEIVNWLLEELKANKQAPHFPIQDVSLIGDKVLCENQIKAYSIDEICKVPSALQYTDMNGTAINGWTVEGNLSIVSSSAYSVNVLGIGNGSGKIIATFQNGQKIVKDVWVGAPQFTFEYTYYDIQPAKSILCVISVDANISLEQMGVTSIVFKNNAVGLSLRKLGDNCVRTTRPLCVEAAVTNVCGTNKTKYQCELFRMSQVTKIFATFPNPAKDNVAIEVRDSSNIPEENSNIKGELYDMFGQIKSKIKFVENRATFSVKGLSKGIYVLKLLINDVEENHQIAVE